MTDFTAYLVGSDGWFEYDAGPAEHAETAVFGWLNFDAADEIVPPSAAGAYKSDNQAMLFNVVVNN